MTRDITSLGQHARGPARQAGLTLIELMIAITISLIVLVALTAMFVSSMRARDEVQRANQQIENGRYAMQVLSDDLQLAGFMGKADLSAPVDLGEDTVLSFDADEDVLCEPDDLDVLKGQAALYIEGANNVTALPGGCDDAGNFFDDGETLSDFKPGTDMLVVRRVSSCAATPAPTTCPAVTGAPYFQVSMCPDDAPDNAVADAIQGYKLAIYPSSNANNTFNLHNRATGGGCNTTSFAEIRRFLTHIYFIANNHQPGDGIPTLKRAELDLDGGNRKFRVVPIAEGIENLQLRYGIDDTAPENGAPDRYENAAALYDPADDSVSIGRWQDVVAVSVHLLARSANPSPGHVDTKTYVLGDVTIAPTDIPTDEKAYKRHVFETVVRLNNPAGVRQP
ncbi:MAG TPA: PilW family protein [Nevskiales bacterium]|nr:PilW family protein [Nevskiales bacterium]